MTRILLLVVVLCASSTSAQEVEKESKLFRALGWGVWAVSAGDAVSTDLALMDPEHFELNPLQVNRYVRIGSHVAYPVFVNMATKKLYQQGKKKQALWVRIAVVSAMGTVTALNLRKAIR